MYVIYKTTNLIIEKIRKANLGKRRDKVVSCFTVKSLQQWQGLLDFMAITARRGTIFNGKNCGVVPTALSNKKKRTCEKCGKETDIGNYAQYHGDNCGMAQVRPKKICENCSKSISYTNYTRWLGENCKYKDKY